MLKGLTFNTIEKGLDQRLLNVIAAAESGDRRRILVQHNEGLVQEIVGKMDLLNKMETLETLKVTLLNIDQKVDTANETISLRKMVATKSKELRESRETINFLRIEVSHKQYAIKSLRQNVATLVEEKDVISTKLAKTTDRCGILTREIQTERFLNTKLQKEIDAGIQLQNDKERKELIYIEEAFKLSVFCQDALRHWVEQTEVNNWAMRVIKDLNESLLHTEKQVFDFMSRISVIDDSGFGLVHHFLDIVNMPCDEWQTKDFDIVDTLVEAKWGVSKISVLKSKKMAMQYHTTSFAALSSFIVNFTDDLCPQRDDLRKTLLEHSSKLQGIFPTFEYPSVSDLIMAPVNNMVKRFKSAPDFAYSQVFVDNKIRVNSIDTMCYQTTGQRRDVLDAWLQYLIGSAVMNTSPRQVHFNGIAMFYGEESFGPNKKVSSKFYSYYRVGLRGNFVQHEYNNFRHSKGSAVAVEVWYPLVFTSFESVMQIADYLQGFPDIIFLIRAKEVKIENNLASVKLVRMKAGIQSEQFGCEKLLTMPQDWFFHAITCWHNMDSQHNNDKCFDKLIEGVHYRIFIRGGILNPRCDNSIVRIGGISNLAFSCNTGKAVHSSGGIFKSHITDPQVKWMSRNYISKSLISDEDLVLFMSHMISEWS
jgi:hypothetical protein